MDHLKPFLKKALRTIHLYEPVKMVWNHLPDFRTTMWNLGYQVYGTSDHISIPPPRLIKYTVNSREIAWFLHTGMISFNCMRSVLENNQYPLEGFHNVLDFGCGCGRVLRYWPVMQNIHLFGCDYNPALIHWDQSHLRKLANFMINSMEPPLNYPDNAFDLVYCLSVFTHFTEELQDAWMEEMYRILQPKGLLLLTLHGKSRLSDLNSEQKEKFLQGELVVVSEESAGANCCGAYEPVEYVRNHLARKFEMVDFIESGARDSNQDIYLFRKPLLQ